MSIRLFLGIRLSALTSLNRFVALSSRLAVIGIMLGVSTLITVLSVMKGFEEEMRYHLIKDLDHLQVYALNHQYPDTLYETLKNKDHVVSVTGFAEAYGLVRLYKEYRPILLTAIESLEDDGIYLSVEDDVFLKSHKTIGLMMPSTHKLMPVTSELRYNGILKNKHFKRSLMMGQVSYDTFQKVTGKKHLSGLSVVVDDLYATTEIKQFVHKKYKGLYQVVDWKDKYEPLFSALRLQRTGMLFVLSMITLVSLFSLVSGLVMLSSDRSKEIALLQIMGVSKKDVRLIFMVQGAFLGLLGVCLGVFLGLLLCHFAEAIMSAIEAFLGYSLIDVMIYGTSRLPTATDSLMVVSVATVSFIASLLATVYPVSKIAKLEPVDVLRYQ